MNAKPPPENQALKEGISIYWSRQDSAEDEDIERIFRDLLNGNLLMAIREAPPGNWNGEFQTLRQDIEIEFLTITTDDGKTDFPVFTDLEELRARKPEATWLASSGEQAVEKFMNEMKNYDAMVVNPAGQYFRLNREMLEVALQMASGELRPRAGSFWEFLKSMFRSS